MNILQFKNNITGERVRGFEYTGFDAIRDVEMFSHLRAHDIYQIDPKNTNAVTCVVSVPINDSGCCTPVVLVPGTYFIKTEGGELQAIPPQLFKGRYTEIKTEGEMI